MTQLIHISNFNYLFQIIVLGFKMLSHEYSVWYCSRAKSVPQAKHFRLWEIIFTSFDRKQGLIYAPPNFQGSDPELT